MVGAVGEAATEPEYACVSDPAELSACTVKLYAPATVGVPEIVLPVRVSPVGRVPAEMLQVIGEVPVADSVWEKGVSFTIEFRVVVVTTGATGVMAAADIQRSPSIIFV